MKSEPLPARIAGYRVVARLGAGGMGEVFLAEDDRLGRRVAVKRLSAAIASSAEARRRMLLEARAAAQLDHPNICSIFEVGEDAGGPFIVMPVVEGETLAARLSRGRLEVREVVGLTMQVADALAAAHATGILHRDIKPGNIMLGTGGRARVMDFGLAKIVESAEARTSAETEAPLTAFGTTLGTAAYMSPEQARCESIDARSDLFSLGVVMFEALTGSSPFDRASTAESLSAVLTVDPPKARALRPETPAELERIVARSLRKDRDERYQSARDLRIDLGALMRSIDGEPAGPEPPRTARRRVTPARAAVGAAALALAALAAAIWAPGAWVRSPAASPPVPSVVMLPFTNGSGSAGNEYLADGLTQALIDAFSQMPGLKVISPDTAFTFRNSGEAPLAIARRLGVASVLTGAVGPADGGLAIDITLNDAADGAVLLSERYLVGVSADLAGTQAEIARDLAGALRLALTEEQERRLTAVPTAHAEAYHHYLRGRFHALRASPDDVYAAIAAFRQSVALDSGFAPGFAALAETYLELGIFFEDPRRAMPQAKAHAARAMEIDPGLVDAQVVLGLVSLLFEWDYDAAVKAMSTSAGLLPQAVRFFACTAHLLDSTGQGQVAEIELNRALGSDPLSSMLRAELGCSAYYARRYDVAVQSSLAALALEPTSVQATFGLARAYGQMKRYDEALGALQQIETKLGVAPPVILAEVGYVQAAAGKVTEARATLERLNTLSTKMFVDPYQIAAIHVALGDPGRAFAALDDAITVRSSFMVSLASDPKWDPIRSDPRFRELLRQVGH